MKRKQTWGREVLAALRGARSRTAGAPRVAVERVAWGQAPSLRSSPRRCLPKLEGPEVGDPTSLAILAETEAGGGERRC